MNTSPNPPNFNKTLVAETDWLASTPIFFNSKHRLVSRKIQQILSASGVTKLHAEGLYNFLDFGYSVFGQTPVEDVRFLDYSSRIWQERSGALTVEQLPDPVDRYMDWRISESDIIELIRERVQAWEASLPSDQEIVLPLSGGFDSRLILWCLRDPTRVRAYTYGLSGNQSKSSEVVYAAYLANRFGVRWERVQLGDFHQYFDAWDAEFGPSTHAHGMYHFEFYAKIRERLKGRHAFLSGIFGDVWAGSIEQKQIDAPADLLRLGYSHGMRADPSRLRLSAVHELRDSFWNGQHEKLFDHRFQTVTTVRLKIILISYLMRVPQLYDFQPWTPYLDIDVAMAMLNLPQKRRMNRQWQRDFFKKVGLDLEDQGLKGTRTNTLNFQALRKRSLPPLSKGILSEIVDPAYLDWVNSGVKPSLIKNSLNSMLTTPRIGGAIRRLKLAPSTLNAYCAYLCLSPLQKIMDK